MENIDNFPIIDIDTAMSELATINEFQPLTGKDIEPDMLEAIINSNLK